MLDILSIFGVPAMLVVPACAVLLVVLFFQKPSKVQLERRVQDFLKLNRDLESPIKRRHYLVILNPYSGDREGKWMWENVIEPMFSSFGAELTYIETKHSDHFTELGQQIAKEFHEDENKKLDGVLCCGGDGSFREFMNGMIFESTKGTMEIGERTNRLLSSVKVCPVPVGSSNGISCCVGNFTVFDVCRNIVTGNEGGKLDLWKIKLYDEDNQLTKIHYDIHCFGIGGVADMDYLLEHKFRWMGKTLKQLVAPLLVILQGKLTEADISIKLAEPCKRYQDQKNFDDPKELISHSDNGMWKRLNSNKFSFFITANGPLGGQDLKFTDDSTLEDGSGISQFCYEGVSRFSLLNLFLKMETGEHVELDYCKNYRTTGFSIDFKERSRISSSGEVMECKRVLAEIQPRIASILY